MMAESSSSSKSNFPNKMAAPAACLQNHRSRKSRQRRRQPLQQVIWTSDYSQSLLSPNRRFLFTLLSYLRDGKTVGLPSPNSPYRHILLPALLGLLTKYFLVLILYSKNWNCSQIRLMFPFSPIILLLET